MAFTKEELAAIEESRGRTSTTRRTTVLPLEDRLFTPVSVLDHGFVRVVDYMGDDGAVVQAARVSYGHGTSKVRDDRGLIRYLMRHRHTTPFEMCEIKLHIKLPIFIARQWIRHRTANVNEYSGRYSVMDKDFYLPNKEHVGVQSANNKQGRGDALPDEKAESIRKQMKHDAETCYEHYIDFLQEGGEDSKGLARELARMNLTLNYYTQWYWKIDLHNLLHFLALRMHPHAQYEIRAYAEAIGQIVAAWVPLCWEAFLDYRLEGVEFSGKELQALRQMLAGYTPNLGEVGLSVREQGEFWQKLADDSKGKES